MEIKEYGEFGLIKHLTEGIKHVQPSTKKGVGDDCAVMDFNVVESEKSKVERDSIFVSKCISPP